MREFDSKSYGQTHEKHNVLYVALINEVEQ